MISLLTHDSELGSSARSSAFRSVYPQPFLAGAYTSGVKTLEVALCGAMV